MPPWRLQLQVGTLGNQRSYVSGFVRFCSRQTLCVTAFLRGDPMSCIPQDDDSFQEVTRADQLRLKNQKKSTYAKTKSPPAKKRKLLKRASKQRLKATKQRKPAQLGWDEAVDEQPNSCGWNWDESRWEWEQDPAWTDEAYWRDAEWWAWEAADWGEHSACPKPTKKKAGAKAASKKPWAKAKPKAKAKAKPSAAPKAKGKAKSKSTDAKSLPAAKGKAKAKTSRKQKATGDDDHDSPASRRRLSGSSATSNPASEAPTTRRSRRSESSANSNPRQPQHSQRDVRELVDFAKLFWDREFKATMKPELKEKVGSCNLDQCSLNIYWTRCSCGVTCKAASKDVAYFFFSSEAVGFTARLCIALKAAQTFVSCLQ